VVCCLRPRSSATTFFHAELTFFPFLFSLSSRRSIDYQTFSPRRRHTWSPQRSWRFSTTSRLPHGTMMTHGEWSSTDERISQCEGLRILKKAWDGSLPEGRSVLQLQSNCPLCQFFKDVMGAPAISHVHIYPIGRLQDGKIISGALGMKISPPGFGNILKFVLRLSSPDEVEDDSPPTSWDQFYTQYETGNPFHTAVSRKIQLI
jgi:hypothetical protein